MSTLSFAVMRLRDFRLLLGTRTLGAMALEAQAIIVGWQIYSLTHSPFMLGLVGLTEAVPALIGALVAGYLVDTSRPHRVLLFCVMALALNMLALFLIAGGIVAVPGGNLVPWIFGGVFFSGLARCFLMPSSYALQPQIIPRPLISAASAWFSGGWQMGVIVGPAMAGIIYGGYGARVAWLLPVSLMAGAVVLTLGIGHPFRHFRSEQKHEPATQSIIAGWKFIIRNRTLLTVMALDMFAVLFGGAVAMLPAYADRVLHVGSEGLGALRAAPALGAIVTALMLAVMPMKRIRAATLLIVVAGFGFSIIGFGLSTLFPLSMLFLALSGAFDSVSMVVRQTLLQWLTPEPMRGRVSSVNSMFIISSNEIGAFESGLAAKLLGLVPSVIFGGVCTLVVVGITALVSPKFRRLVVDAEEVP